MNENGDPVKIRVDEGPVGFFSKGSFYRTLIDLAVGGPTSIVGRIAEADLIVGSYASRPLAVSAASIDRFISRRTGRWMTPVSGLVTRGGAKNGTPRLWFTAENARPPSSGWTRTLSFDMDSLGGYNEYLPLWWAEVGIIPGSGSSTEGRLGRSVTVDELLQPRAHVEPRPLFACAFLNNPEPMRLRAIAALGELGQVDVYGRVTGKPIPRKLDVAGQYRHMLCFENDVYPGYVTEKIVEAWAAGCLPLWRGQDPAGYLNPAAMLNAADGSTIDGLVNRVAELEANSEALMTMLSQPLLLKKPDISRAIQHIRSALNPR